MRPGASLLGVGLVAGLLPALYMQFACMYAPAHILMFHIGPGLAVAGLAALAGLALSARKEV